MTFATLDMNAVLPRVIIAPVISKGQPSACRPVVPLEGKDARILLDQLRAVDKRRLTQKMGFIDPALWHEVLLEMFR
ncbi:type II toxin-antitoxin system PemK/MazF family toxin [Thioalkalicoccus limnaeus]|uniref:Type II toxin-antitoxin system PemK/MazF family toxin n=1 Tax=Thioalkalicoccus limnaeus TaxID=120681 RepID=A0ABV4BFF7_9GAMM